jgi:hypothetical protein
LKAEIGEAQSTCKETQKATWGLLGERFRDLILVSAEATDEMQILVLRLAVKEAERVHSTGNKHASAG